MVTEWPGGSLLRIEPVRKKQEDTEFECVAENGVGDPVSVSAHLQVHDGKAEQKTTLPRLQNLLNLESPIP